jgi:LysR family transcriptional regulator, glycine cleavage system transcriptional activator
VSHRLPSMAGLRAFEATARHLSLTRAATELSLTQGAISHQLRNLEELLGDKLFERHGNEMALTEMGKDYLPSARAALTELQIATDRAIERHRGASLTIACLGTFAIKCLLPNLGDFLQSRPEANVRVRTLAPHAPLSPDDYDVSIQYGSSDDWTGMVARRITDEELFPVCSPALLQAPGALAIPQDLSRQVVIRTSSPFILSDDWPLWLEKAGVPGQQFAGEMSCDLLYPSYQAAMAGLGVAMGRSAVVEGDLKAGRLVAPFDIRLSSPLGYHLVMTSRRAQLAKVAEFCEWAEAHFSRLRLPPERPR